MSIPLQQQRESSMQAHLQTKRTLRILGFSALVMASVMILGLMVPSLAYAESAGQYVDDATITTKIKAAFLNDSQVKLGDINVTTDHGAVQLTGTVNSQNEESDAVRDAYGVNGVQVVLDKLTIRNPTKNDSD
jgi:hypothetical protein